jgi:hypothetical protein
MKKALVILLAVVTMNANAQLEKSATEMYSIRNLVTTETQVKIIRTDDVMKTCDAESKKLGFGGFRGTLMEACSFHNNKTCTIIVGYRTNNDILGHEFRHCIQGSFH